MREIKFRVWDNMKKCFLQNMRVSIEVNKSFLQHPQGFSFQQFTGLKDQKGTEIYEGDILRTEKRFYKKIWVNPASYQAGFSLSAPEGHIYLEAVKWGEIPGDMNDDCLGWIIGNGESLLGRLNFCKHISENAYSKDISKSIEVIGNIYENSELLQ